MRIGINALYLLPGKVGGSEIYLRNLVRCLTGVDAANEYLIFINKESVGIFEELAPSMKVVPCPVRASSRPLRILWEQLVLPFQVSRHKIDILLSAGMTSPFLCPVPSVVVIYDLQHVNQPQNFQKWYLLFLKTIIYMSARTSKKVITLSEKSKKDIIKYYNIGPERVGVTYMASDNKSFFRRTGEEVSSIRKKYNLPERFILYIASSLPHKNYERLLSAFKRVKESGIPIKLVLIGARDYGHDVISEKIKELGLTEDVVFLGWLPFEDIPLIYSASEVFVFPSLHEGFGIPVVEAFASGVPVVCSKIEPLTEVGGSAAFFVDPMDPEEIAKGILSVLNDKALRGRLVEEGFRRAGDFSWEKTAIDTVTILRSCLPEGREMQGSC